MPELRWNEYEVIECLGVLPEKEEFSTSHYFKLAKDGLILEMTIWQHESCVALSFSKEDAEKPFITFYFIVRGRVEFVNERNFASLRFLDSVLVSSRFWMYDREKTGDYFKKDFFPKEADFELTVHPHFEFKVL